MVVLLHCENTETNLILFLLYRMNVWWLFLVHGALGAPGDSCDQWEVRWGARINTMCYSPLHPNPQVGNVWGNGYDAHLIFTVDHEVTQAQTQL